MEERSMKKSFLSVTASMRIQRPIAIVCQQFGDVEHHARNRVHPDVKFTLRSQSENECRYRQAYRLAGIPLPLADEVILKRAADGTITNEVLSGSNAGARLTSRFRADGPSATLAEVTIELPLAGPKKLLAPLVRLLIRRQLAKGLEEDRRDLEDGGYPAQRPGGTA